ncbi:MAG: glycosyltransferase family 4 protein [Nitrospinae bacterium]|nr:glycosyltransferase family 4 protein [Nitrospinota bacterium]
MNIGIDIRPALKARTGVGNYALNLAGALARLDRANRYYLFSNSFRDRLPEGLVEGRENLRIRDRRFPNLLMNFVWDRVGGWPISLLLRGLDVFHFTGAVSPGLKGVKTVATVYDLYHVRDPESVAEKHRVPQRRFAENLKSVSKIISISAFTRRDLCDIFGIPPEKVAVVPLGVDPDVFRPLDKNECRAYLRQKFRLDGDYLLFVGTLETRKNLTALAEAFRLVRSRHAGLKLVLAGGPGHGFDKVREKIREWGVEDSVFYPGYLEGAEDLVRLYCGADVFVFPSVYEGFGLPLLEAFACGVPVAASDRAAIPETAGEAALQFNPGQPEDIAAKILNILEDGGLAESLKSRGLARAGEFSWERTARKTLEVYESLRVRP